MNAIKNDFGNVLDPCELQPGWFYLELVGFQVIPNPELSAEKQTLVQDTIDRLKLNQFCQQRAEDAERYWDKDYSLRVLRDESPFVASELRRQNRLNAGDQW